MKRKQVDEKEISHGDPFRVPNRNIRFLTEPENDLVMKTLGKSKDDNQKDFLFPERKILPLAMAAKFMGISKSHLYKLTSTNRIEFFRPMGKLIYISVEKCNEFLTQNKIKTVNEIQTEASNFLIKTNRRAKS